MKNYISTFAKTLNDFGDNHLMVDAVEFIRGESDLDTMVFDRKTLIVMMSSANLDNENGRPIYEVDYIVAVVDKAAKTDYGTSACVEESLFVLGQLQDHLLEEGWSVRFGEVDIQTDFDDSGDLVVLSTEFTAEFGRGLFDEMAM